VFNECVFQPFVTKNPPGRLGEPSLPALPRQRFSTLSLFAPFLAAEAFA
jgi:hypothetical protein